MPDRWAGDLARRRDAGIPGDLVFATKPQLAMDQLERLLAAGLPARWAAFDEVYGRSEKLRKQAAKAGLAYVAIIPCDYQVTLPSGTVIRADEAVKDAVFERRSCGNGSKGPRYSDWAMTATGIEGQSLLIRRLISRPDQLTFYLCWAPPGRPATMTYFITIAGRRWPVEETFKTGKDVHGWDQSQARHLGRPSAGTLPWPPSPSSAPPPSAARSTGSITLPAAGPGTATAPTAATAASATLTCRSPSATRPSRTAAASPARPASRRSSCPSPRPPGSPVLARQHAAGLITRARLAFALRWSLRRRLHQATARWHHYSARLLAATDRVTSRGRKEVTPCNRTPDNRRHAERQRRHTAENRDCNTGKRSAPRPPTFARRAAA